MQTIFSRPLVKTAASTALLALVACSGDDSFRDLTTGVAVAPSVDFGITFIGRAPPATAEFAIQATGEAPVKVVGIVPPQPEVAVTIDPVLTVAAGSTTSIPLTWSPSAAGELEGQLRVYIELEEGEMHEVELFGIAIAVPSCDDLNQCTDDTFDFTSRACVHTWRPGSCDDGNACTKDDSCFEGVCRGTALGCDDESICTFDLCDPATGCIFPPNPNACSDGDPCTVDECDAEDGCEYPNAPSGTPCGAIDCRTAHICILGSCDERDISGYSDGMPCFDGDICTEGDECSAGECMPGPALRGVPEIVASLETFGGAGSYVTTDGLAYLFVRPGRLNLMFPSASGLERTASLPMAEPLPPLAVPGSGFLVAQRDGHFGLLDASDHANPVWLWEQDLADPEPPAAPYDEQVVFLTHWAQTTGGLVLAVRFSYRLAGEIVEERRGIYFLRVAPPPAPPLALLATLSAPADDLDADGNVVAWAAGSELAWRYLDGSGAVHERAQNDWTGGRLSVRGRRVARLSPEGLLVDEVQRAVVDPPPCSAGGCEALRPGCGLPSLPVAGSYAECAADPRRCPAGTACTEVSVDPCDLGAPSCDCDERRSLCISTGESVFVPHASHSFFDRFAQGDPLLDDSGLFVARDTLPAGVLRVSAEAGLAQTAPPQIVDRMPARRLDRATGHLLLSGDLALPLQQAGSDFVRVTGMLHGDVSVVLDGPEGTAYVAGPVAVGALDLTTMTASSWSLRWGSALSAPVWVMRGATVDAAILAPLVHAPISFAPECEGYVIELVDPVDGARDAPACGLYAGATYTAASRRLWAHTPVASEADSWALRAWELDDTAGEPVISAEEIAGTGALASSTRLRPSDERSKLLVLSRALQETGETVRVDLYEAAAGALAEPQRIEVACPDSCTAANTDPLRAASDGELLLLSDSESVSLYDVTAPSAPLFTVALAAAPSAARVLWMAGGRAWMAQQAPSGEWSLSQIDYSLGPLRASEPVMLPAPPERALDLGNYALMPAAGNLLVVGAACF